ncbi:uncharacterized protein LOC106663552 [Cimex lectularius]|uniref:C2H2-type domain-containing protein n=1 Tax=Cimex lectularius TaxID=79782 RepID=A0A8I6RET8_CIMLE|nr:uncharacterized protein LOC106663552 [Cimex lectularius]
MELAQTEKKRKQSEENLPREGVSSEDYNSEDSDASFGQSKLGKKRNSKPSLKMKEILFSRLASKVFEQTRSSGASDEMIDEDNTTNSENSDGNNLFSEINWEENIEVDASDLIDEFAPRPTSKDVKTEEPEPEPKEELAPDQQSMEAEIKEEYKEKIELNGKLDTEILEQEFKPGLKLYVMDYKCSTWNEATIAEVDWEENEVLVQYGDSTKSEEWVAMSSQRLSRLIPDNSQIPTRPTITSQTSEIVIKPTEGQQEDKDIYKKRVKKSHIRSSLKNMKSLNKKALKRSNMPREQIAKLESAVSPKHKGKFQIGEKVLAKWSEHRMQKFPAIIKKMAGQGSYDVLFYDGFEKTISEDHLYKTTEEESAKYRHSNPSEADSFVDMDADSKEARRQRKKKTFDDYVFVKDLQKKQRKQEGFSMKKHYFKSKDISSMKSKSSLKKKKKLLLLENENRQQDKMEEFQDYPITSTPIKQDALVHEPQPENKINPETDRWSCDISVTARPISIAGPLEGTSFRTVIIPDKQLSNGWVKHAIQLNEEWKAFLISPDKYKVNSIEELKDYFGRLHKSFQRNLDFTYPSHLLPKLIEKQRDLEAINEVFPNWIIRKKIGKKHGTVKSPIKTIHPLSSVNKVGKVRTLLPKYRVEPSSSSPALTPPTEPVPSDGDNVWKCVKEGCEKKFRKESLLQMHIKHYHVEFESLVGAAPNVVDLALARSEIANSDPGPSKSPFPVKRIPSTSVKSEHDPIVQSIAPQMPQSSPVMPRQERNENLAPKRPYQPLEEKKPTIKTIFPFSQSSSLDSSSRLNFESDDFESDEEKLFKPQPKYKKPKPSAIKDETISRPEPTYPVAPGLRYIKKKIAVIDKQQVGTDSNGKLNIGLSGK